MPLLKAKNLWMLKGSSLTANSFGKNKSQTQRKSNESLNAVWMIKIFFTPGELKILLETNYFSVFYYNSAMWLTLFLQSSPKQQLLSASVHAMCSCLNYTNPYLSFETLHKQFKKSTPDQMAVYKISLSLNKTFNGKILGEKLDRSE